MFGRKLAVFTFAALMFAFGSLAMAQQGGGGRGNRGGGQGGGPGGGNFDPAQMRQRMMDRMKEQLGATDDEWKVLLPKLEKVMEAQRNARGGAFGGMMGGRGGRGGDQAPTTTLGKAAQELRATLENKDAKADDIAAKLKAYRTARDEAQAELAKAQKDLKEVLTLRQEAQLTLSGTLE